MPKSIETIYRRHKARQNQWVHQAQTDPQFGGPLFEQNLKLAQQAVQHFGDKKFQEVLNITGLGSHPDVIRVFWRIGQAMNKAPNANDNRLLERSSKSIGQLFYPGFEE